MSLCSTVKPVETKEVSRQFAKKGFAAGVCLYSRPAGSIVLDGSDAVANDLSRSASSSGTGEDD